MKISDDAVVDVGEAVGLDHDWDAACLRPRQRVWLYGEGATIACIYGGGSVSLGCS
jgi:hypothetical protein